MKKSFLVAFLSLYFSCKLFAQNFTNGFVFSLPWNDSTSQKFLPDFPVQNINEFISVNKDGNFAVGGKRIKFWGGNLVADGAFPEKSNADAIAGRLRKMGFNLIRLHHLDNNWGEGSLFDQWDNTRKLNPVTLDKLEYLISALKNNGIYIDMNLNVSRTFKTTDGVANADSIVDFGKGVTLFDPQLIALQKEYAEELLTHVNPYTGKALDDDPVMAMVEIVNENSLFRMWRDNKLKTFGEGGSLILRHSKMLDSLWNYYLSNKYSSTQNLATAWNEGSTLGNYSDQIKNGDFENSLNNWGFEHYEGAMATQTRDIVNPFDGVLSAKIVVTNTTGTAWHLQWEQYNLKIKKDSLYTVEFAARADGNRKISVSAMAHTSPYTGYGNTEINLTSDWKTFSFSFKAPEDNNNVRLSFGLSYANNTGNFWFDDIKFESSGKTGLQENESVENGTVKRMEYKDCVKYTEQRIKDISDFYISLQDNFFAEMIENLKNTLGVKVPVVGTNWNVGPGDLASQSKADYVDNHAYWDHPQFPGIPWSSTDWKISNTPIVTTKEGTTIADLFAGNAIAGKPYTVSELNDCFPNRYQTESLIFTTAYSSFHDADAIMWFDYNGGKEWIEDKISSYFDLHRNSAMMSLMPSCAYAFRNSHISEAKEIIKLNYSKDFIDLLPENDNYNWMGPELFNHKISLIHEVRNESFNSLQTTDFSSLSTPPVNPYVTDTKEINWNTDGIITVNTSHFIGSSGFLNNFTNYNIGDLEIMAANDFGTITWVSLTKDSLSVSEKSLLTVSSVTQNTGMVWDDIYTFHSNWGSKPTQMKPLNLDLKLNIYADSIIVYPLDKYGKELFQFARKYKPVSNNSFEINVNQSLDKSLWYGIEKFGDGVVTSIEKGVNKADYRLEQNYPNPFNPSTTIEIHLGNTGPVNLSVYNLLGQKVATLLSQYMTSGIYQLHFNAENLPSGIYFYDLNTNGKRWTRKMQLLK